MNPTKVQNLLDKPYRCPPKEQRREEIRLLANHLNNPRWLATADFIEKHPGELTWVEEQDLHCGLWQEIVSAQHLRRHIGVA